MEYNLKKDNVNFFRTLYEGGTEVGIDTQINLPEYCRDAERILKCFVTPNITSCRISGDRVTVEGEAVIRTVYISDDGTVECCEQSVTFSKYAEVHDMDNECNAIAYATSEYVNCRVVSRRRLSVNGSINVHFSVTSLSSVQVATETEGGGVETKKEKFTVDMPIAQCRKLFEIGETAELSQSDFPISSVIRVDATADINSVKCIADKMLIKGDMTVNVFYRADAETNSSVHFKHIMPISQIVELAGVNENSICDCTVTVSSVNATAKADSKGETRLIDIAVKAFMCVEAYENREITLITDGFSTEYEVDAEYKNIELLQRICDYNETKSVRSSVDISNLNISEIEDTTCRKLDGTAVNDGEKIVANFGADIGILYKDSESEYAYIERTVDFSFDFPMKGTDKDISVSPSFSVADISCATVGSDKLEVKMSVNILMPVFERVQVYACTEIQPDENRKKTESANALTVYFADAGEKLWDIAQKYNTTIGILKSENDISQDILSEKTMMIISEA